MASETSPSLSTEWSLSSSLEAASSFDADGAEVSLAGRGLVIEAFKLDFKGIDLVSFAPVVAAVPFTFRFLVGGMDILEKFMRDVADVAAAVEKFQALEFGVGLVLALGRQCQAARTENRGRASLAYISVPSPPVL